jgi:exopolysaccharide production protein ExoY
MHQIEENSKRRPGSSYAADAAPRKMKLMAKRMLDIIGALVFFGLFIIVYFSVWWMVLITTGGPAIYKHRRVGRDGREFDCLKFRSMVVNSDEVLKELLSKDTNARFEWETTFKLKNDPRVTRFGRLSAQIALHEDHS